MTKLSQLGKENGAYAIRRDIEDYKKAEGQHDLELAECVESMAHRMARSGHTPADTLTLANTFREKFQRNTDLSNLVQIANNENALRIIAGLPRIISEQEVSTGSND